VLVERGCRRLRQVSRVAGRAELFVRYSDGMPAVQRTELKPPLTRDWALFQKLRSVFESAVARRGRVRSMMLRLGRLGPAPAQMLLFEEMNEEEVDVLPGLDAARERSLLSTLDRIRGKHGERALMTGGTMPGGVMIGDAPVRSARVGDAIAAGAPATLTTSTFKTSTVKR
jgi:hypothetical protein